MIFDAEEGIKLFYFKIIKLGKCEIYAFINDSSKYSIAQKFVAM